MKMLPPKEAYVNVHWGERSMSYCARDLWWKLRNGMFKMANKEGDRKLLSNQLQKLDVDGDGEVPMKEIQLALQNVLWCSIEESEVSLLAEFVHSFADMTHDGRVTLKDLKVFAAEREELSERNDGWDDLSPEQKWGVLVPQ